MFISWVKQRHHGMKVEVLELPKKKPVLYSGEDVYIDHSVTVQSYSTPDEQTLQPGVYEFPFEFQLEKSFPSTSEGSNGHIRYFCQAKITGPNEFKTINAFTVVRPLDLSRTPMYKNPVQARDHKEVTCCGLERGEIIATIGLDKTAYAPGEYMMINAEVTNNTSTTVRNSAAVLKKITVARGHMGGIFASGMFGTSERSEVVAEVCGGGVIPGEVGAWKNVPLMVPPLPPSTSTQLDYSDLFSVKYVIVFQAGVKYGSDIKVEEPITIGSCPTIQFLPYSTQEPITTQPTPLGDLPDQNGQVSYNDLPSRYAECISGKINVQEEDTKYQHIPSYPFFHMSPPAMANNVANRM